MTGAALASPVASRWRVTIALAGRALRIQLRRIQFLLPSFVLPLLLLVVIASGTSAAQELPGFPVKSSYVGFVVSGTIMQGALLVGLMAGIAVADDIEGGFFDRLLSAPIHRASIVAARGVGRGRLRGRGRGVGRVGSLGRGLGLGAVAGDELAGGVDLGAGGVEHAALRLDAQRVGVRKSPRGRACSLRGGPRAGRGISL